MIKLAAFDVDGTLRDNGAVPESTIRALRKLKANGVTIALCTGRSQYEMKSLWAELDMDWAVTCNGSQVAYRGNTVYGRTFKEQTVRDWLRLADKRRHAMLLYSGDTMYLNREGDPYFAVAREQIGFMDPVPLTPDVDLADMYQAIVFCKQEEEGEYAALADELYMHRWREWAIDFNPSGVNKARGLEWLARHLGYGREEVAAFGDGSNDIEMIESVGMGIAMGNGIDAVKQKARYVTKRLDEDGIEYAVDTWILPGV